MTTIISGLLQNSIVVALLCPVAWLVCRALQSRPAVQHLVWLMLLVKLVLPPVVVWPWAMNVGAWQAPQATSHQQTSNTLSTDHGIDELTAELALTEAQLVAISELEVTRPPQVSTWLSSQHDWLPWLPSGIWLSGMLVAVIVLARQITRQRRVRRDASTAASWLVDLVRHVAVRMRMRPIRTVVSDRIVSPMICCLGAPRLLWPNSRDDAGSSQASEGVVAHELAHVARRDHYVAWFEMAVSVVLWWHPLAWWLKLRLRESRELACDALAVSVVPDRQAYANLLLQLSSASNDQWVAASALGVGDASRKSLERRLIMIFNERASGRVSLSSVMVLSLLAVLCVPGWSLSDDPQVADAVAPVEPKALEPPVTPDAPVPPKAPVTLDFKSAHVLDISGTAIDPANAEKLAAEAHQAQAEYLMRVASEAAVSDVQFFDTTTGQEKPGEQASWRYLTRALTSENKTLGQMNLDDGSTLTVELQTDGSLLVTAKNGDTARTMQVRVPQTAVPVVSDRLAVGYGFKTATTLDGKAVFVITDQTGAADGEVGDAQHADIDKLTPVIVDSNQELKMRDEALRKNESLRWQKRFHQLESQLETIPQDVDKTQPLGDATAQPDLQRELLTADIEEAEANLEEKKIKLEQIAPLAAKGAEISHQVQLLQLDVKKAEIELRRSQLRLKIHDRTQETHASNPVSLNSLQDFDFQMPQPQPQTIDVQAGLGK